MVNVEVPDAVNVLNEVAPVTLTVEENVDAPAAKVELKLNEVPVAAPILGVVRYGEDAKTNNPEPVASETAAFKLELVGVAKKLATPVPKPDTPVEIGRPVALVKTPDTGVPSAGETNVLFDSVSVPNKVANVPVVGSIILVGPVEVKVVV